MQSFVVPQGDGFAMKLSFSAAFSHVVELTLGPVLAPSP